MIVGAGPAGISTWLHLQKEAPQLAGRSIVIEKAVFRMQNRAAARHEEEGNGAVFSLETMLYM